MSLKKKSDPVTYYIYSSKYFSDFKLLKLLVFIAIFLMQKEMFLQKLH